MLNQTYSPQFSTKIEKKSTSPFLWLFLCLLGYCPFFLYPTTRPPSASRKVSSSRWQFTYTQTFGATSSSSFVLLLFCFVCFFHGGGNGSGRHLKNHPPTLEKKEEQREIIFFFLVLFLRGQLRNKKEKDSELGAVWGRNWPITRRGRLFPSLK